MSGHLIGCVKDLTLPASQKLALIAFADSADDRTHIAFPGYEGVQAWAGVSRSRAAELIRSLVTAGHLQLYRSARPGRRAEYVVFPDGCCVLHRPVAEATELDVDQLAAAAGVSVEQARRLLDSLQNGSTPSTSNESGGSDLFESGASDPSPLNESDAPDPFSAAQGNESSLPDPSFEHVQNESDTSDPFTTSERSTPPTPRQRGESAAARTNPAASSTGCPRHTTEQAPGCRGCGTTPRQVEAARKRAAKKAAREAERARVEAERERAERLRATGPTPATNRLLEETRAQLRRKTHQTATPRKAAR